MRIGVVGCGDISDIYLQNMIEKFNNIEVVACCAGHFENARRKAEQYGICACSYEELLQDSSIEMVVVLTPAPTHYELIRQALEAGKHVYTEKTMTVGLKEAKELLELADRKGLYLGAAPDTFLGSALQTARKAIDEGVIGEVTSFHIAANRNLDILAGFAKYMRMPGGGICFDYGVYYLTALVSLLGPVEQVSAVVKNRSKVRINQIPDSPEYGQQYLYPNESQTAAVIQMENGIIGDFLLNGDSILKDLADFTIYGTKGVLKLADPNQFGGKIVLISDSHDWSAENEVIVLENIFAYSENSRGIGPAEMADAIQSGRKNRANKEMAYHVLDTICRMMDSSESGAFVKVESTCERPEAFAGGGSLM